MKSNLEMTAHPIEEHLAKPAAEFTKADLLRYIEENNIEMINLRYVGGDGRLKTLNFAIQSKDHLNQILSSGERVDGSSLFDHVEAGSSDLYVVPRYKTAFVNPFAEIPSVDVLCSYFDKDGNPLANSPENILRKASKALKENTGYEFHAMGELEFYIIKEEDELFPAEDQKGYHETFPYNKSEYFRNEALNLIAYCGGKVKYGHSEVGNFRKNGMEYEQNEIEFLPLPAEDAADQLIVAKWVLRALAYEHGVTLTFAPKITAGKAGSGMHVHTKIVKNGRSVMTEKGKLSDIAKKAIAGYLDLAGSLTAFGNTIPTSYLRLVPHQEAPTNICWGDRNRSVLVRVPLGWAEGINMAKVINPLEPEEEIDYSEKQTVEFRAPDGSADIYLLIAGLIVAARHGLQMDNALDYAKKTYVDVNIFDEEHKSKQEVLEGLPVSCVESAARLMKDKQAYTKYNVFSESMIDSLAENLKAFEDENLRQEIEHDDDKTMEIVSKFIHCA
ncbi:MAG: glutamine synthetase family protein [Bacteroidales bacterium]